MFGYDCTSPQDYLKIPQFLGLFFILLLGLWLSAEKFLFSQTYKLLAKLLIILIAVTYLFFLTPYGQPRLNRIWSSLSAGTDMIKLDPAVQNKIVSHHKSAAGYILYFGYTFCPDVCPTSLYTVNHFLKKLTAEEKPTPTLFFITLDPERDTLERMTEYLKFFNGSFLFLPLEENEKNNFIKNFGVKHKINKHQSTDKNYVIDHSANIYFLDSEANPIFTIEHGTSTEEIYKQYVDKTKKGDTL